MKKVTKITLISISILILAALITFFTLKLQNKTPKIAFYNIPENHKKAILSCLEDSSSTSFEVIDLDSTIPFSKHENLLKKVSLAFVVTDSDSLEFALTNKLVKPISENFSSDMPISIKTSIKTKEGGLSYIPFLYDMYQIDINYNHFKKTSLSQINRWNDLMNLAKEEISFLPSPITITFFDNKEYLNIFGQIFESLSSYPEYEKLYNELYDAYKLDISSGNTSQNVSDLIKEKLKSDILLKNTFSQINKMLEEKQISKSSLKFTMQDTMFYCDNEFSGIIFSKLSDHRKISRDVIGHYKTIYVPPLFSDDNRKFVANEYSIIKFKDDDFSNKMIFDLTVRLQYELATTSGLAPVQKNSKVPDRQADDVRYWLAASSGPLLPLSAAIPDSKAQEIVANLLRP